MSDNIFVVTDQVRKVWDTVDELRARRRRVTHPSENRHLMTLAESGNGKTLSVINYIERYAPPSTSRNELAEWDVRPVVLAQAPAPFTVKNLYKSILSNAFSIEVRATERTEDLVVATRAALRNCETEVLVIDEIHEALSGSLRRTAASELMSNIKYLSLTSNVVLWFVGLPSAQRLLDLDPQYKRRFMVRRFTRFQTVDKAWKEFIEAFLQGSSLGYDDILLADAVLKEVLDKTQGRPWRVADLFHRALALAAKNQCRITPEIIKQSGGQLADDGLALD